MTDGGGRKVRATRNSVKKHVGVMGTVKLDTLSMCVHRLADTVAR